MSDKTGGPAFPLADSNAEYMSTSRQECNGMTLRDYFAAKAMQALTGRYVCVEVVRAAYEHADAMLAERAK
jgi:hypothetical protein